MSYRSTHLLLITVSLLVVIAATQSFQMSTHLDSPNIREAPEHPKEPAERTSPKIIFCYGVGAKNILDTFEGTFTKDLIGDPPITIRMWLTDEEISRIEGKLKEIGFFNNSTLTLYHIPDAGGVSTIQSHYSTCYLKVQYGTHVKELRWIDQCVSPKTEAKENLDELSDLIQNIIMAKPEYQKLPEPRGGYA
jgi:hypothetical protein